MIQTALIEQAVQIMNAGFSIPPLGAGKRAVIYVSAIDAVSPLTVATARRLWFAKAIVELLRQFAYQIHCHGLLNDADESVNNLVVSIWLRYLQLCGEDVSYPAGCYQGDYIFDFAATVHRTFGNRWALAANEIEDVIAAGGDLAARMQAWLGDDAVSTIKQIGLQGINQAIVSDAQQIGMAGSHWRRTSELAGTGAVVAGIDRLEFAGLVQTAGGADYLNLPDTPKILLQTKTGPTPFALQLIDFLAFAKDCENSDLSICIFDLDCSDEIECFRKCAFYVGYAIETMVEKPISSPQLFEAGELVHTSPLTEDFVSFREARQIAGWPQLLWHFAIHRSDEAMNIDLAGEQGVGYTCDSLYQRITSESRIDANELTQMLTANQSRGVELLLKAIVEFPATVDRSRKTLEPVLIINYCRKLCESILSYYNNHQPMVSDEGQLEGVGPAITTGFRELADNVRQLIGLNSSQ